jgi:hypothetical protein
MWLPSLIVPSPHWRVICSHTRFATCLTCIHALGNVFASQAYLRVGAWLHNTLWRFLHSWTALRSSQEALTVRFHTHSIARSFTHSHTRALIFIRILRVEPYSRTLTHSITHSHVHTLTTHCTVSSPISTSADRDSSTAHVNVHRLRPPPRLQQRLQLRRASDRPQRSVQPHRKSIRKRPH